MDSNSLKFLTNAQYIKDLSFENPGAPVSIVSPNIKPNILLNVNVSAQHLQEDIYEVILHLNVKAEAENEVLFLIDLQYAGLFTLDTENSAEKEEVLLIECPMILFPFARRIIRDCSADGGLQPLLLDPINFERLFREHKFRINQNEELVERVTN
jgi:preprotein translocase subunit SecB